MMWFSDVSFGNAKVARRVSCKIMFILGTVRLYNNHNFFVAIEARNRSRLYRSTEELHEKPSQGSNAARERDEKYLHDAEEYACRG